MVTIEPYQNTDLNAHDNISIQYQNNDQNDSTVTTMKVMETSFKSNETSLQNFLSHIKGSNNEGEDGEEDADSEPTQCDIPEAVL